MQLILAMAVVAAVTGQAGARETSSRQGEQRSWAGAPRHAGDRWRYVFYQDHWWFWSRSERWSFYEGGRWIDLDLMGQPRVGPGRLIPGAGKQPAAQAAPGRPPLATGFGVLPSPASRAGDFAGASGAAMARAFAGGFAAGSESSSLGDFGAGAKVASPTNPYGPDSEYGAYGSTDPFRGGIHLGGGGNLGYGLGSRAVLPARPANSSWDAMRSIPSGALGVYGLPKSTGRP